MTGWWRRRRARRASLCDHTEALAVLDRLRARDAEIARIGRELRAAQDRNHFSEMVAQALARTRSTHA